MWYMNFKAKLEVSWSQILRVGEFNSYVNQIEIEAFESCCGYKILIKLWFKLIKVAQWKFNTKKALKIMSGKSHFLWNTESLPYDDIYKVVFINLEKFWIFFFGQITLLRKVFNT